MFSIVCFLVCVFVFVDVGIGGALETGLVRLRWKLFHCALRNENVIIVLVVDVLRMLGIL